MSQSCAGRSVGVGLRRAWQRILLAERQGGCGDDDARGVPVWQDQVDV